MRVRVRVRVRIRVRVRVTVTGAKGVSAAAPVVSMSCTRRNASGRALMYTCQRHARTGTSKRSSSQSGTVVPTAGIHERASMAPQLAASGRPRAAAAAPAPSEYCERACAARAHWATYEVFWSKGRKPSPSTRRMVPPSTGPPVGVTARRRGSAK